MSGSIQKISALPIQAMIVLLLVSASTTLSSQTAHAANPNGITCDQILTPDVVKNIESRFPNFSSKSVIEISHAVNNYLSCTSPGRGPIFGIAETSLVSGVNILPAGPVEAREQCMSGNVTAPLEVNQQVEIFQTQIGQVCARNENNTVEYMLFEPGYQVTSGAYLTNFESNERLIPEPEDFNLAILAQQRDLVRALVGLEPGTPFTSATEVRADSPSSLSALRNLREVDLNPTALVGVSGGTLIFVALLAIPGIFTQTGFNTGYERLKRWLHSKKKKSISQSKISFNQIPAIVLIPTTLLVASVIAAFSIPTFGINAQTLRVILTFLGGFTIEGLLLSLLVLGLLRARGGTVKLVVKLSSIIMLTLGVLMTRLTSFEPGFLYGVTITVALLATNSKANNVTKAVSEWLLLLVIGLLSWIAYSLQFPVNDNNSVIYIYFNELFSSITVGALTGATLMMLPITGLAGQVIKLRNKWLWLGAAFMSLMVFFIVVLPFPGSWQEINSSFVAWTSIFVLYVIVAFVFWGIARSKPRQAQLTDV